MGNRTEYQREYQRRRRVVDKERARAESAGAYSRRKVREKSDPALKARRKEKAHAWREAHLEHVAVKARAYYDLKYRDGIASERRREMQRLGMARYRSNAINRVKLRARWRASRALGDGRLVRRPCEVCGYTPAQMHHDSYARPLEVRWLCKPHHEAAHHAR